MRRSVPFLLLLVLSMACAGAWRWRENHTLRWRQSDTDVFADGREHPVGELSSAGAALRTDEVTVTGKGSSAVRLEQHGAAIAVLYQAAVNPGIVAGELHARGGTFPLHLVSVPTDADTFGDGTPDWMRLHSAEDRAAFRQWFTEAAERMADTTEAQQPAEINDCASLLRYSYREALRVHDDRWYRQFAPVAQPTFKSVQQWSYPNTPLGTGLFRIRPGKYALADNTDGAFQSFADAKTLMLFNTFFLGRDVHRALPGDLMFYRVLEQDSQYHSMIFTGERGEWVVYHTGPIDKHRGEMRRVLLADLLQHPNAKWRPVPENPNFLGVFRWNILREE